ncbi:hypothetical protein F5Y15DRAFT_426885 [Xylariaceae sp. FL0016]|nr:hypothetical protein F5Y15DRAFT_426885 [Xylariaceae sp. FL0016]
MGADDIVVPARRTPSPRMLIAATTSHPTILGHPSWQTETTQTRPSLASASPSHVVGVVNGRFDVVEIRGMEAHVRIARTLAMSRVSSYGYDDRLLDSSIEDTVSSTETHLRNEGSDYGYNLDAARTYANQARGAVSPLNSLAQYSTDLSAGSGDVLGSYRQNPYPYSSSKSYYSTMSGWGGTYQDDGVDYGLNYSPYPMISQDPSHLVQGYSRYSGKAPVYVDEGSSSYSYGNLVHRPAVSNDSQGFAMSGMAASLPPATSSDRLHSQVNRTLTGSSSYRADGVPSPYSTAKGSSANAAIPEVGYSSVPSSFDSPYSATSTLASQRSASHGDSSAYTPGGGSAADTLYGAAAPSDQALRPAEDASAAGLSYLYGGSDRNGSRRDSHSSGGAASAGTMLSNGHAYVPDASHHAHAAAAFSHGYMVPAGAQGDRTTATAVAVAASAGGRGGGGGGGGGGGSSHAPSEGHRRSAGSLRGG